MRDSQCCVFFGALLLFFPAGMAAPNGGSYVCKNTPWTHGEKVTIELRIDRSKYPSSCPTNANGRPTFETLINGTAVYTPKCTSSTDLRVNCSFPAGALGCGCVNSDANGFYVLEYNFIADPDHRWWKPNVFCLQSFANAFVLSGTNCSNITIVPQAVDPSLQADVMVSCEPLVENAVSYCHCAISRDAATSPNKCRFPVAQVTLTFCTSLSVCSTCVFNDYSIGMVGRKDKGLAECSLEDYNEKRRTHVLRVGVLAYAAEHNMSTLLCQPNCVNGLLTQNTSGIPARFSPFCAGGVYGAECNLTCNEDCVDHICTRKTGYCRTDTDLKYKYVYIAVGVATPLLLGLLLAINKWCKRTKACCGPVEEMEVDKGEEKYPGSKQAQETGQVGAVASPLTGSLVPPDLGSETVESSTETSCKSSEVSLSAATSEESRQ